MYGHLNVKLFHFPGGSLALYKPTFCAYQNILHHGPERDSPNFCRTESQ